MVPLPKSKRRRDELGQPQPQQHVPPSNQTRTRTEVPQPQPQDSSMNTHYSSSNHASHANAESIGTVENTANTKKRPNQKTVVILDAPQRNSPSSSSLRVSVPDEMNLNLSLRSLGSASYSSAIEFMVDAVNDDQNVSTKDDHNNHHHHNSSTSTNCTARKSSDSSSTSHHSSSKTTGHTASSTTALRRQRPNDDDDDDGDDDDDVRNTDRATPELLDRDNDDDDQLTGWEFFVSTISNVPDEEYYTKTCTTAYDVLQKLRITLGYAVSNPIVQTMIVFLIIVNAILMGVATFDFVTENPHVVQIFSTVDSIFLIIFTIELGLQLFYRGLSLINDAWLVFDFIIIVLSWSLQSIQIIRAFRIFRALRLVSRLQVLRELITALGAVMPRMYAISMLLLLIFYIFAVLFTQLFGELELSGNYFTTLDASLFTCMNMMTLEWVNVTRELMTHFSWAWAPVSSFISITGFIVYNLVVAVVCDAVAVLDRNKQQEAEAAQREIDDQEYEVTRRDHMQITQQRFDDLSNNIELMKQQHINICHTVDMLSSELQQSMIVIANLQQQLAQAQEAKR